MISRRAGFCTWFLLLIGTALSAQTPPRVSLEQFLARGVDCERQQLWQQAAEVYERALRLYPDRPELRDRWQQAERRFSLSRRYHDSSFTGEMLELSQPDAIDLYAEVVRKIQSYYVDPIEPGRLVAAGRRNLDLALSESIFLERHLSPRQRELARSIRLALAKRAADSVHSTDEAVAEVVRDADLCRQLGLDAPVAVTMEYLAAASEGLDPYSTHLSPNRLRDLYALIDGNFVGLGVEVRGHSRGLVVMDVLPGSPAAEAGLAEGDILIAVDQQPIAGLSTEESANRLQGPAGSTVRLQVVRAGASPRQILLARREVIVHSITSAQILDRASGIGYVRMTSFQKQTARELEEAVAQLEQAGMRALVIDLRGNPGGLLDTALHVANRFISQGVLVSTQGRSWGQSWSHRARPMPTWSMPLAILIDGESASASEILAGAIQDHGRGTIVGTRSFGKGSVQSIFPLRSANTGLRLTTAHFYSPKGKVYQGVGVAPDVVVSRPRGSFGEELPVGRHVDLARDLQLARAAAVLRPVK